MEIINVSERKGNGFENLTGKRFGRLTVLGLSPRKSGRKSYWVCKCDCGNEIAFRSDMLKNGNTRSCGCLKREQDKTNLSKFHKGYHTPTRLYGIWTGMKQRCNNPNDLSYKRYGGRGIRVCNEWLNNYGAFRDWAFSHGYSKFLTIDRIDVNGNYEPNNCRWLNAKGQANNRRSNHYITWQDETHTIEKWAEIYGLKYGTLRDRYERGDVPPRLFESVEERRKKLKGAIYVEWKGQCLNLRQWAKKIGINSATLKGRYERGKRPPELFKPVQKHNKKIPR